MKGLMRCFIGILFFFSLSAFADQATDSTGDYDTDLGQVYGFIVSVNGLKNMCVQDFPVFAKANEDAYKKWRAKNLKFIQDIQRRFDNVMKEDAKGDMQKYRANLENMAKMLTQTDAGTKQQIVDHGPNSWENVCVNYPKMLEQVHRFANMQNYYAEQIATIRSRPN